MNEDISKLYDLIGRIVSDQERIFESLSKMNEHLVESSDARMDIFAQTMEKLSNSIYSCSKMVQHLEKTYTAHIQQALDSRDSFKDAYVKLLHKYEKLEDDYFNTLKELARRPTITNTTSE